MSSSNGGYSLNTIKGHGLAVGDRFVFHGLASDPIPTPEGTRVEISKVGAKYMLTTVTGDVITWEFGPSAKVWADTTVSHHVTTEARTLDNGDTVHTGQCEHGWMTGFHTTADGEPITDGLAVWDYNLDAGRVVMSSMDGDGWFYVDIPGKPRSLMNGERVTTVHPFTRQTASDALAEDAAPLDIPAPGEAEALQAEHDAAMAEWSAPLVSILTVPAPVVTEDATVIVSPGDTVYRERDGAQGVVRDVLTSGEVDVAFPGGAGMVRTALELISEGFEIIPVAEVTEGEVWAGTGTVVTYPISRPVRTALNRRKRKATKVNARRVRGGF